MKNYVLGFMFRENEVLLIEKKRPNWQAGMWNGVGGKIEDGETPEQAMRREFKEEAGDMSQGWWHNFIVLLCGDCTVHVFYSYCWQRAEAKSMTDERVEWFQWMTLPGNALPSTKWLVPMARDVECPFPASRSNDPESPTMPQVIQCGATMGGLS